MISIVTASYNYANFIKETIQSVLNQTYTDWEMIIVDDCSSDNSVEIIKSYNDERIKLYINEENLGLSKTIQKGIKKACGDWIVFLESDDYITPDYLEKKIQIAEKYPSVNLIFNDCEFFGDEKKVFDFNAVLKRTRKILNQNKYPFNMFYYFYHSNKIFTFSAVMAKKEDLLKINYEPKLDYLLDWHLWIQMAYLGEFYFINEKLTYWRLHNNSYIKNSTYKNPFNLQFKSYIDVFKKTHDYKIIFMILFLHPLWYAKQIKKAIRLSLAKMVNKEQ